MGKLCMNFKNFLYPKHRIFFHYYIFHGLFEVSPVVYFLIKYTLDYTIIFTAPPVGVKIRLYCMVDLLYVT